MLPSHYEQIGGADAIAKLSTCFYRLMDECPEFAGIRAMHPADLQNARDKFFMFLSGWMGGPPLYEEKFGHPMLRRRHLHVSIGEAERDQWMDCMMRAMREIGIAEELQKDLYKSFLKVADFMRNRDEIPHKTPV